MYKRDIAQFNREHVQVDCHLQKETVHETGLEGYDSSKLKKIAGLSESPTSTAEKFDTEESFAVTKSSV